MGHFFGPRSSGLRCLWFFGLVGFKGVVVQLNRHAFLGQCRSKCSEVFRDPPPQRLEGFKGDPSSLAHLGVDLDDGSGPYTP